MLHNEKLNPNLKKFEISQSDFYSLDRASFYEISSSEIWDFSEAKEIHFEFIPFFIMRAILHKKITGEPIELKNLPLHFRQNILKFGLSIPLHEFFSGVFFPTVVGAKVSQKLEFYHKFIENYNFYREVINDNFVICGGGILKSENILLKPFIIELFETFKLEEKKGKLYFRTYKNSYFYPLDKKETPQIFFVQEREPFIINFYFFYIEIENS